MNRLSIFVIATAVLAALAGSTTAATQGPILGAFGDVNATGTYTPRSLAASGVANGRLWIIGGSNGTSTVNTVEGYNPATNAWEAADPMPTPRKDCAGVAVNGKIYVIGGYEGVTGNPKSAKVEVFDPTQPTGSQWQAAANMPIAMADTVAVLYNAVTGPQIHVIAGDAGTAPLADHTYVIYDVNNNTWSNSPKRAPTAARQAMGAVAKDMTNGISYLYLINGWTGGEDVTREDWRIDPATASTKDWDSHVHITTGGRYYGAAITIDAVDSAGNPAQYIALYGGTGDRFNAKGTSGSIFVYMSGTVNNWLYKVGANLVAVTNLPQGRTERPAMGVINGKLYIAGGKVSNIGATPVVWGTSVLAATINSNNYPPTPVAEPKIIVGWEDAKANIPTPRSFVSYGVVNNKLYVMGGAPTTSTFTGATQVFDPATNAWTTLTPMPIPVSGAASAVVNGLIYVAGGQSATNKYESALQIYDPATDTWTVGPAMPTARQLPCGYAVNGQFHVVGGQTQASATSYNGVATHEIYDPLTNAWTSSVTALNLPSWHTVFNGSCTEVLVKNTSGATVWDWVYVVAGNNANTEISSSARYNANPGGQYGDKWYVDPPNIPVGGMTGAAMTTVTDIDGWPRPVVFGGHNGPIPMYDRVWVYHDGGDPTSFKTMWLEDTPLPTARGDRPAVAQIGNYIYITGGSDRNGSRMSATWRGLIGSGTPLDVTAIGDAIKQPNGKKVNITTAQLATRSYTTTGQEKYFWIEDADRSSALRVGPSPVLVNSGDKVVLSGMMSRDSVTGERTLTPSSVTVTRGPFALPKPIGLTNKSFIGGSTAYQPGRPGGLGLNNLGMLVRICGRVTADLNYDEGYDHKWYFYIDDGSNLVDGTAFGTQPYRGIRVYFTSGYVSLNDYVVATGIASCETVNGTMVPVLLSDDLLMSDPNGYYVVPQP